MIRRAMPLAVLALWLAAICWCSAGCEPSKPTTAELVDQLIAQCMQIKEEREICIEAFKGVYEQASRCAREKDLASPLTVYENADGRIAIEPRLPEHAR